MRQEAVSPCSWGPGDTGDQSPRQVLFSTEPPPPVSPPCDEGPTTSGTKLHSSSCLGSRVTPTLPVPVAHPLIMPVEPAAGCATAGTVGRRCLSRGMAVVLTPPQVSPPPRDPLLPAQPLVISVLLWVPACPPSFQCPDWGGLERAQYSFSHSFEYMCLVIYDGTFPASREGGKMEEQCPFSGSVVRSALPVPWTEEPGGLQSTGSQRVGHD